MALVFFQEPVDAADKVPVITNWTPLIGYILYRNDGSYLDNKYYYKLVLEVYTGTAVVAANLIGSIKQRRNGYSSDVTNNRARAFFDLRDLANTQLIDTVYDQNDDGVPFRTIHKLGANTDTKQFSTNGDEGSGKTQIVALTVKGFENYSTAANTQPVDVTDDAITDTLWYLQASLPLMTARNSDSDYIQSDVFNVYNCNSATDKFLSDLQNSVGEHNIYGYVNNVQSTDYHTVSFLNDYTNFASDLDYIEVKFYTAAGATISTSYIQNVAANGGATPSSWALYAKERLIYFGCGPANLEAQDDTSARPSNNANWEYYTIRGSDDGSGSNYRTAPYYFIKQDGSCKGFKVRRLAWRNSLGSYDYFNFKMKSTQTINVQRNNYSSMLGTFNKSKWRYNNTQRGKTTRQTTAVLKETLNTDWLNEQEAVLLENLIMSTNVQIVENADTEFTEGVIVTDTSFIKKTSANDKMIKYTINIEYANPVNTNS